MSAEREGMALWTALPQMAAGQVEQFLRILGHRHREQQRLDTQLVGSPVAHRGPLT